MSVQLVSSWEHDLRARLIAREPQALTDVYDHFVRSVFGLAARVSCDRHAAEDITQEVFIKVWNEPEGFDPARGSMRTWLAMLAHSGAVTWVRRSEAERRRERRGAESAPVTSGGVEEAVESVIVSERARVALAALPAEQRRTIELAYLKGLTYREVAERLGIPEGTAKSRIRLGLGRMAQRLRDGVCDRQLT